MVLVGPSGCGKSTLLRILTGLLPPTEGHVLYRGQPMHGVSPHVTLVFQTFVLFPRMTVQQNVEIALKAKGVPPAERTARATELLDRVGLDGFESASPRELSGGMRQRGETFAEASIHLLKSSGAAGIDLGHGPHGPGARVRARRS